jgi:hypothetical protein
MKRKLLLGILISSFSIISVFAQKYDRVKLKEQPVLISKVKNIGGFYGQRMELNRNVYLKKFPIDHYVDFIEKREHTAWSWTESEQHGKWIESAYLSAIQADDKELLSKAEMVLRRVLNSQEDEGYVGSTARSFRTPERPVRGMDAYELYFVFHAFMTVYEETGNKDALKGAEKLANYFIKYFGPGKLEFWPSDIREPQNRFMRKMEGRSDFAGHTVHYSWEGTLLCDPIARLYELTGEKKYLNWSKWLVDNIDKWSGWDAFSRLDSVADGTLGIDKLQPYVHSHTFHMNFMGFLRLYRITGDKSLLKKVSGAWDDISKRQMYITGGVSVAEHYESGFVKPLSGNIVETCATMSWMQLTQQLLELTGDTKYADAMEKLMINHVFAGQDIETGSCRYHTAPNGTKPEGFFHGPDCCTASGHRIISLLPSFLYAENGKDFFINQYLPSEYSSKNFSFKLEGAYPEKENISLTITSEKATNRNLKLRIPSWCTSPSVSINGETIQEVQAGNYLTITRQWNKGDRIELIFNMECKWVKRQHHSKYISYRTTGGEIMYREEVTDKIPYAYIRGPIVYSLDMVWNKQLNNDDLNIEKDLRICTDVTPEITNKPNMNIMGPLYKTKAIYKGHEVQVILTPFVNTGQWFRPGEIKPNKYSDHFTYAIWLYNTEDK